MCLLGISICVYITVAIYFARWSEYSWVDTTEETVNCPTETGSQKMTFIFTKRYHKKPDPEAGTDWMFLPKKYIQTCDSKSEVKSE